MFELTISKQIIISQSIEKIFSYISNYTNDVYWRDGVIEMKQIPDGKISVGTETFETIKFMGKKLLVKAKVTEYEINKRSAFKSVDAPIKTWGYREVKDAGIGTVEVVYSLSANLTGIYSLFNNSIKKMYTKRIDTDLKKLKSILEQK